MYTEPEFLGQLFAAAPTGAATHYAYPRLGRVRLLLPVDGTAAAVGKSFFFSGWKRFRLEAFHLAGLTCKLFRHSGVQEAGWVAGLKELAGKGAARVVVSAGTPGPYAKATVLLLDSEARPLAVGKVGSTPSAIRLLENEWAWLRALSGQPRLAGRVPAPVAAQRFGEVYVILQSIGAGRVAGRSLGPDVVGFLAALQESSAEGTHFAGSTMHENMHTRLERLQGELSAGWQSRAEAALQRLDRGFRDRSVRMAAAHRDFVPWNMRALPAGVFVFDWEYASGGYLPLYDLFHFLLMPEALERDVSPRDLARVMRQAVDASRSLPGAAGVLADHQLLAYLLDLSLFYLEANAGQDRGDRVLARYARLIDKFEAWRIS